MYIPLYRSKISVSIICEGLSKYTGLMNHYNGTIRTRGFPRLTSARRAQSPVSTNSFRGLQYRTYAAFVEYYIMSQTRTFVELGQRF
jgi:hypothetical protein